MGEAITSPPRNGPQFYRTDGQIYRLVWSLYPQGVNEPQYGQVYILDSAEATTKRPETKSK
jgi:hypothetical protein